MRLKDRPLRLSPRGSPRRTFNNLDLLPIRKIKLSCLFDIQFLFCASYLCLLLQIGKPFVISKLRDYPQFRSVAIAIHRSGFKIVLLLRLVPLLPFNMLNYLLSVTPVSLLEYMLASWIGMMPITLALVYIGTTLKDLSDVTHGWSKFSKTRWAFLISGLMISVILMVCVTKVAKAALDKALVENEDIDGILGSPELPIVSEPPADLNQPLIIKIEGTDES